MSLDNPFSMPESQWDKYFHEICKTVSTKSLCLSRKIGAILVRDKVVLSTGYNGPPKGIPSCSYRAVNDLLYQQELSKRVISHSLFEDQCPRRVLNFSSSTGMEWCPATHAEVNAVINAAKVGVSIKDSTLYLNSVLPCRECTKVLINSGIVEIVSESLNPYDPYSDYLRSFSRIRFRTFCHIGQS